MRRFRGLRAGPRRGVIALGMAFAILLIAFITVSAFLMAILTGGVRSENALREAQALYAAEAGIDLAAQSGALSLTGECGRARYAVQRVGGRLRALGQVQRPSGAPIRCAVTVRIGSAGVVDGSWRQLPPARVPELAAMLEAEEQ
ncbi:MAG: hypothetical protein ACP5KN_12045 [Armatimonadota bacterium]